MPRRFSPMLAQKTEMLFEKLAERALHHQAEPADEVLRVIWVTVAGSPPGAQTARIL